LDETNPSTTAPIVLRFVVTVGSVLPMLEKKEAFNEEISEIK
jgi:hypothetical protein